VPNRKPTIKEEVPGALFTSIVWILFSYIFSIYIDYFTNFSSVYGSLTYIVLFMLWMYINMDIVFMGALLNCFLAEGNHLISRKAKKKISQLRPGEHSSCE
jgi:membrane protein